MNDREVAAPLPEPIIEHMKGGKVTACIHGYTVVGVCPECKTNTPEVSPLPEIASHCELSNDGKHHSSNDDLFCAYCDTRIAVNSPAPLGEAAHEVTLLRYPEDVIERLTKRVMELEDDLASKAVPVGEGELPPLEVASLVTEVAHYSDVSVRRVRDELLQSIRRERDQSEHIKYSYAALGDVSKNIYLFDHIHNLQAELARLRSQEKSEKCVGYPLCDGDLIGEEHDPSCPAYTPPE